MISRLRLMSTSLLHSRAYQCFIAEAHAFSDSVLCFGKMGDDLVESWKSKIQWYSDNNCFKDLKRIDGQPMEFEWKIFPGLTAMGFLNLLQQMMGENYSVNQRTSLVGSSFMSMFNDIVWDAKGNDEICENNSKTIKQFARRIPRGHWSFPGPGFEKERYGTYDYKPDGSWDRTAEKMLLTFAETNHPAFRGASVWERGDQEGSGKKSIHFHAAPKALSFFSDWSSPSTSSASTEQWRIWLKN